ncbi:hypothetical protein H131_13083 [Lysinibacillus sphaericus OT4b.31]|uniref:Uncharacterized protein n=1 Tax=Lysinibacillus sphaericus OT4b.31 TaxID=1285586 RepID=R7ZCX8_LYSSH|nr:hypothetical protein H131_13083 [Lysinibacillus sphaericus OT4b.31]
MEVFLYEVILNLFAEVTFTVVNTNYLVYPYLTLSEQFRLSVSCEEAIALVENKFAVAVLGWPVDSVF